jgi:hypothetical protein
MNDALERTLKEEAMAYLRYYPVCPKGLRKTMKTSVTIAGLQVEI